MDPSDIAALFYGDEATGPEKAQQLAAALRGDTQLGQLGLLTGDKVLGGVGQSLIQGAQQGNQQLEKAANMRLTRAMEAEKQKTEQAFRQAQEAHFAKSEAADAQRLGLERQRLNQDAFHVTQLGPGGPVVKWSGKTGSVEAVPDLGGAAGGPAKLSKDDEKEFLQFADRISTSGGRGSSPQLKAQADRLNSSQRILAIAQNPDGTPRNLSPQMMTELAAASGSMLSNGGQATEGMIHNLTPSTLGGDVARIQQWLTNEPAGTGQQAFVKALIDQAHREEAVIRPQIRSAQFEKLPAYSHLRGKDKARFDSILKGVGIDPESVDDRGLELKLEKAAAAAGGAPGLSKDEAAEFEALHKKYGGGK